VTSRRNLDLLNPIAAAFVEAVLQFCKHPTLRYTWPQFLPSLDEPIEFLQRLNETIEHYLSETPVLESRHGAKFRKLNEVKLLSRSFMDENDDPIIDDDKLDPYMSGNYPPTSSDVLKMYGLKNNNVKLVLKLLQRDLDSPNSRVKSYRCEKWHSALSQILLNVERSRLQCFKMLPLRNGRWVSAETCTTFLPTTDGIPIPEGLPMSILDALAVSNTDRENLYMHLGASEPRISEVRACILGCYGPFSDTVGLEASRSHLHFLYKSHRAKNTKEDLKRIYIYDSNGHSSYTDSTDFFLRSTKPYGPYMLLGASTGSAGLEVNFLHPDYLKDIPAALDTALPSWERWLHVTLGVRKRLRLVSRNGATLSDTWKFVAEHRPEKLLGLLKYLWAYEGSDLSKRPDLIASIRHASARDLCSPRISSPCSLQQTYLPLTTLRQECRRFLDESEEFPFLELEGFSSSLESSTGWMFLHSFFLVGKDQNLAFFLDILARMKTANDKAFPKRKAQQVLDLYATMGPYASKTSSDNELVR
jgi:hypothetical protein